MAFARKELGLLAVNSLIEWFLFNLFVGNCDAHAKNISLLYAPDGRPRLTPHYDLVCTTVYPDVSRNLAMACGHTTAIDEVTQASLRQLAESCGVAARFVTKRFAAMCDAVPSAIQAAGAQASALGIEEPILAPLVAHLRERHIRMAELT